LTGAGGSRRGSLEPRGWDAATYDRVAEPQRRWALAVLDRLPLAGDETVLDAGCGSGRVTAELADRVPQGKVIAVDADAAMVAHAREALGDRVEVLRCDLLDLALDRRVDAIFSNAVFHWIPDHDRLFERLYAALRPGGRLIAQYGGEGNVARLHRIARELGARDPFAAHLAGWEGPWNFTSAEAARASLDRAGFEDVEAWLEPWPVQPPEPRAFIRTVCLGPHLARLPEPLREPYLDAVADAIGDPLEIDYVRLNVSATRGH
jgi:trans-aconitate 2-methyltransferase